MIFPGFCMNFVGGFLWLEGGPPPSATLAPTSPRAPNTPPQGPLPDGEEFAVRHKHWNPDFHLDPLESGPVPVVQPKPAAVTPSSTSDGSFALDLRLGTNTASLGDGFGMRGAGSACIGVWEFGLPVGR